ncbi:MAG: hypothetical protein QM500_15550 [Methylococcales bacterium]
MSKKKTNQNELANIAFTDIEDVNITVVIKGKTYAIAPKKGRGKDAMISRQTAFYLVLDEHFVVTPSIEETLEFLNLKKEF